MSKLPTKIDVDIFSKANESDTLDSLFAQKINAIISYLSEQGEEKKSLDNSVEIAGQTFLKAEPHADHVNSVGHYIREWIGLGKNRHIVLKDVPFYLKQIELGKLMQVVKQDKSISGVTPPHADHSGTVTDMVERGWEKEFDENFGEKVKSYTTNDLKSFISSLLTTTRQEERERVKRIVRNMPPYRKTNNHDRLVYEEVLSDILTAIE